MYQTGLTIKETLDDIHSHKLVLPAIQREFVWHPDQISKLFDSIMQGYPFGTFLYWVVAPENSSKFKFYDFVREYHQRDNPHCPQLSDIYNRELTAVLDGQQRLTAFNIGLRGSIARKLPHKWWKSPDAFPVTRMYLDLLWKSDNDDEEGIQYNFKFLTKEKASEASDGTFWFPVSQVLEMTDSGPTMVRWLNERLAQEEVDDAYAALHKLHEVVHKSRLIAYYQERNQELDRALQIFIRMNDGGTPLSHSDLLLSIAVAQWTHLDAREEIYGLVDELNRIGDGFTFSQDFVLKAGLMLSDIGSVGFKVDNFGQENMRIFEERWTEIKSALILTVQLVSAFGFSGRNLTAHNAILPIAYYLHAKAPGENILSRSEFEEDRRIIRDWLMRSLLKAGVWGSGLDTLLTELRRVIKEDDVASFPSRQIKEAMARRGKALVFEEEEIEELLDLQYGDRLTFVLLSLLFPLVDLRYQFHVDHIFPRDQFSQRKLRDAGVPDELVAIFQEEKDSISNLQLIEGTANLEKAAKLPTEWLDSLGNDKKQQKYKESHLLDDLPDSICEFDEFCRSRRRELKRRIVRTLGR